MRRTDTSGEGKEQFHAERVVGPQNRAELQLGSRPLRHVAIKEPASRFNFSDTFRQAVVELSGGTTLFFRTGLRNIYLLMFIRVSRSSRAAVAPKHVKFVESHCFKCATNLKHRC